MFVRKHNEIDINIHSPKLFSWPLLCMPDGPGRRPWIPREIKATRIVLCVLKYSNGRQATRNNRDKYHINQPCKPLIIETPEEIDVGKECLDCCSIEMDVPCRSWLLPLLDKKSTVSNFGCWDWICGCRGISLFCWLTSDRVVSFAVWLPSESPELLSSSSDEWPVTDESNAFLFFKKL